MQEATLFLLTGTNTEEAQHSFLQKNCEQSDFSCDVEKNVVIFITASLEAFLEF